jgi:hypothetical protein
VHRGPPGDGLSQVSVVEAPRLISGSATSCAIERFRRFSFVSRCRRQGYLDPDAQSAGHKELDIEPMKAFIRWRVKPTAVKYIDVPATFTAEGKSAPLLYDRAIGEITSQTERQVG